MYFSRFLYALLASAASVAGSPSHLSSEATSIIAVVTVAPGKFERFMELQAETLNYVRRNEPGTLQLETYVVSQGGNGTEISLFEKYANEAARTIHLNSQNYASLFATYNRENILSGMPTIYQGNISQALDHGGRNDGYPRWKLSWANHGE